MYKWLPRLMLAQARELPLAVFAAKVASPACMLIVTEGHEAEFVSALAPGAERFETVVVPSVTAVLSAIHSGIGIRTGAAGRAKLPDAIAELFNVACHLVAVPVGAAPATLGRERSNAIVLRHRTVSRVHAYAEVSPTGEVAIGDAGGKNGIRVNGTRIDERTQVTSEDRLGFGEIQARVLRTTELWEMAKEA